MMGAHGNWIDRALGYVAPQLGLRRMRARVASDVLARHYEAASTGRRTQGWRRSSGDVNAGSGPALARLRDHARDLVRNNGHAEAGLRTITNHVVGWGILAKPKKTNARALAAWKAWAESTDCDADGRKNFYGIQRLAMRTIAESGEVLIRRRVRRPEDGLSLPIQLQVLDPDFLDTLKTGIRTPNGGQIINGIEFDALGRRVAYWLFREHPGSQLVTGVQSVRVPAESVIHGYREDRPGQVRGISWFAPVILSFKDFDEYEDATLMKQKIAACLAVMITDPDGNMPALGTADATQAPEWDSLEPGLVKYVTPGSSVEVVQPPSVREYPDYSRVTLRKIAAGFGAPYEDMTGDYSGMPFSAARMSRIRHWDDVHEWRWQMLIPQVCDPAWRWAMEAAAVMGLGGDVELEAEWTAPPAPMVDPANEGLAYMRNIRAGVMTLHEAIRERGYDPETFFQEYAEGNKKLDALGIILDSDARNTTQAGNPRQSSGGGATGDPEPGPKAPPVAPKPVSTDEDDEEEETE